MVGMGSGSSFEPPPVELLVEELLFDPAPCPPEPWLVVLETWSAGMGAAPPISVVV